MSDQNPIPPYWNEAEKFVRGLILTIGPEATKAAVLATFDIHAAKYRESATGDTWYKLVLSANALQVIRNEAHK